MKHVLVRIPLDVYEKIVNSSIENDRSINKQMVHLFKKALSIKNSLISKG